VTTLSLSAKSVGTHFASAMLGFICCLAYVWFASQHSKYYLEERLAGHVAELYNIEYELPPDFRGPIRKDLVCSILLHSKELIDRSKGEELAEWQMIKSTQNTIDDIKKRYPDMINRCGFDVT